MPTRKQPDKRSGAKAESLPDKNRNDARKQEGEFQPHNAKKEALGSNTKQ